MGRSWRIRSRTRGLAEPARRLQSSQVAALFVCGRMRDEMPLHRDILNLVTHAQISSMNIIPSGFEKKNNSNAEKQQQQILGIVK